MTDIVSIWTDGACSRNPGPGGWGAILQYNHRKLLLSGYSPHTTNNQMELQAAIEALKALKRPSRVEIHTDSQYLRNGIQTWLTNWIENGWVTKRKEPIKNRELWEELHRLTLTHLVNWHWVRGHSGNFMNEQADRLATEAIKNRHGLKHREVDNNDH